MTSFTSLDAWHTGMELTKEVYRITKSFPPEERYGITSQLRRASISILTNIAEGYSRKDSADKAYKYTIARGECSEVYALLLTIIELGFVTKLQIEHAIQLSLKEGQMLSGLIRAFRTRTRTRKPMK